MIDFKTQEALRAKFNPDGSNLRKMQLRMLDMLKYIDKICREHNIKYWLSSGTCLGAVRHGGFIPWDDDCDIELLRKDYKKLIKILKEQHHPEYFLQDFTTDKDYIHPFAKLRDLKSRTKEDNNSDKWSKYNGCYIDIFCSEPSCSSFLWKISPFIRSKLLVFSFHINNIRIRRSYMKFSIILLTKYINPIIRLINTLSKTSIYRNTLGTNFLKKRYYVDIKDIIYVPFESESFPVPINYNHYLTSIYGDYEKLPELRNLHPHFISVQIFD